MTILSLAIVGAILSLLVEAIKKVAGFTRLGTITIVVALSLVSGALYYQFRDNVAFWEATLAILAMANLIYEFLIKSFKE
jgi:hypothetical protein